MATISETIEFRFGASSLFLSLSPSIDKFRIRFATKLDEGGDDKI